ncbi:hypothetical protein DFJ74DRAFT_665872 [Hyaloraphidium curvatum]|nr:hypothetical protein DFJ74DRAFT_665872 [Hyaloraphidium curvatum]
MGSHWPLTVGILEDLSIPICSWKRTRDARHNATHLSTTSNAPWRGSGLARIWHGAEGSDVDVDGRMARCVERLAVPDAYNCCCSWINGSGVRLRPRSLVEHEQPPHDRPAPFARPGRQLGDEVPVRLLQPHPARVVGVRDQTDLEPPRHVAEHAQRRARAVGAQPLRAEEGHAEDGGAKVDGADHEGGKEGTAGAAAHDVRAGDESVPFPAVVPRAEVEADDVAVQPRLQVVQEARGVQVVPVGEDEVRAVELGGQAARIVLPEDGVQRGIRHRVAVIGVRRVQGAIQERLYVPLAHPAADVEERRQHADHLRAAEHAPRIPARGAFERGVIGAGVGQRIHRGQRHRAERERGEELRDRGQLGAVGAHEQAGVQRAGGPVAARGRRGFGPRGRANRGEKHE